MIKSNISVRERQDPLRKSYQTRPEAALITDRARTGGGVKESPFHGWVYPGEDRHQSAIPFGIHRAVGGYHDQPNPGDLLCAALASCLDSTIRIIAERLGVLLSELAVEVTAQADVRGTLMVDREVPVGFQHIQCKVKLRAAEGTPPETLQTLLASAEHCCVNLQTLRQGIAVETTLVDEGRPH